MLLRRMGKRLAALFLIGTLFLAQDAPVLAEEDVEENAEILSVDAWSSEEDEEILSTDDTTEESVDDTTEEPADDTAEESADDTAEESAEDETGLQEASEVMEVESEGYGQEDIEEEALPVNDEAEDILTEVEEPEDIPEESETEDIGETEEPEDLEEVEEAENISENAAADETEEEQPSEVVVSEEADALNVDSDWLNDYEYNHTPGSGKIYLTSYKGNKDYTHINGTATIGSEYCRVHIAEALFEGQTGLENIQFFNDVIIEGNVTRMFRNCSNLVYVSMSEASVSGITDASYMFFGCSRLDNLILPKPMDLSGATNLNAMFSGCAALETLDLSNWNTPQVTQIAGMFYGAAKLKSLDLSRLDTSSVTNFSNMFNGCSALETILISSKWDTANAIKSTNMFAGCTSLVGGMGTVCDGQAYVDASYARGDSGEMPGYLTDTALLEAYKQFTYKFSVDKKDIILSKYNGNDTVVNVPASFTIDGNTYHTALSGSGIFKEKGSITGIYFQKGVSFKGDVSEMFNGCFALSTLRVDEVDTSLMENAARMFYRCQKLSALNLADWNTAVTTNMQQMFAQCETILKLDLKSFNTAKVTDMLQMFSQCTSLKELDVSGFDTSKVYTMNMMFANCGALESVDVSGFNVSGVNDFGSMFSGCEKLSSLSVDKWDMSKASILTQMFSGCTALSKLNLSGWSAPSLLYTDKMFSGCKAISTLNLSGFNMTGVHRVSEMFKGCSSLKTIRVSKVRWNLYNTQSGYREDVFKDCTSLVGGYGTVCDGSTNVDYTYARIDRAGNPGYLTDIVPAWGDFSCELNGNLAIIISYTGLDTDITIPAELEIENQKYKVCLTGNVFEGKDKLKSITFEKGVSLIGYLDYMFYDCEALESIKGFEGVSTEKAVSMKYMFEDCKNLKELDVSGFNTSKVTSMDSMFAGCGSLNKLDVGGFDTKPVESFSAMFYGCSSLSDIDVSHFDTSNAADLTAMFASCPKLTSLNLMSFETDNVISTMGMFYQDSALKTIYVSSKWNMEKVTQSDMMFTDCAKLVGGYGTKYNANYVGASYAHIDKKGAPGYLSGHFAISGAQISSVAKQTYSGKAIQPALKLSFGGESLALNKDYTLFWQNNINASKNAKVTIQGIGNYYGSVQKGFEIGVAAQSITSAKAKSSTIVSGQSTTSVVKGKPAPFVGKMVFAAKNKASKAIVSVNKNTGAIKGLKPGTATISVYVAAVGKNATKSKTIDYKVKVTKPKKMNLSKASGGKNYMKLRWKKQTASGYILEYATNKSFTGNKKTVKISKAATTSRTIKKLKSGTWYVRIFAYGNTTSIRSAAGKYKTVKVK